MKNNHTKKLLCHVLVLALACSAAAGTGGNSQAAKKTKLAVKKMTLMKGKSKKIKIKNKKKGAKYRFKASNKKIRVYSSGKVKALKAGTAKVTVKETYKKKTKKIGTVTVKVRNICVLPPKPTTNTNDTDTATAAPTETNNAPTQTPDKDQPSDNTSMPDGPNSDKEPPKTDDEPGVTEVYTNYFEDGDTKGFVGRGGTIEVSNSENHTAGGMNSMLCTGRTATWHGASLAISKMVEVGSTYQFSAWVKQDSGSAENIAMKLQYTDPDGNTQYKSIVANAENGLACPSGEWTELKGAYEIPENGGDITLYFEAPNSETIDFLVDDVIITGKAVDNNSFKVTDEVMQQMVQSSLYSAGNNARIKNVIEKARAGEDVSLAYIGGSVTEGALASPNSKCYAEVSATAFAEKYGKDGGANVHFINAGMSGTPSDIGVVRYERDVLDRLPEGSDHPDILFIEFAVNDYGCETKGGAYEGLIREALKSGSAVVLIFSVFQGMNRVCENDYRKYGEHYDLPMVSMGDAISAYSKEDGFEDWYFGDSLHPNNNGYQLMANCIMNLFGTLDGEAAEADNITDVDAMAPKTTSAYQGIKMIDQTTQLDGNPAITSIDNGGFDKKDTATGSFQYEYNGQKSAAWFPNNWMHSSTSGSEPLKITVNCSTLMLIYKLSNSSQYGKADLYIDGVKKATLNCHDSSGWNNGKVYLALTEDEAATHEIELKMAEENEEKNFTLLAIGYK